MGKGLVQVVRRQNGCSTEPRAAEVCRGNAATQRNGGSLHIPTPAYIHNGGRSLHNEGVCGEQLENTLVGDAREDVVFQAPLKVPRLKPRFGPQELLVCSRNGCMCVRMAADTTW